jgi:hypothetical protein
MEKKILTALAAALSIGVVVLAWIAGHAIVSFVWGGLISLIVLHHLDRRFGWSLALKILVIDYLIAYLKRKDKKEEDLATFMTERHRSGVDKITKVR